MTDKLLLLYCLPGVETGEIVGVLGVEVEVAVVVVVADSVDLTMGGSGLFSVFTNTAKYTGNE